MKIQIKSRSTSPKLVTLFLALFIVIVLAVGMYFISTQTVHTQSKAASSSSDKQNIIANSLNPAAQQSANQDCQSNMGSLFPTYNISDDVCASNLSPFTLYSCSKSGYYTSNLTGKCSFGLFDCCNNQENIAKIGDKICIDHSSAGSVASCKPQAIPCPDGQTEITDSNKAPLNCAAVINGTTSLGHCCSNNAPLPSPNNNCGQLNLDCERMWNGKGVCLYNNNDNPDPDHHTDCGVNSASCKLGDQQMRGSYKWNLYAGSSEIVSTDNGCYYVFGPAKNRTNVCTTARSNYDSKGLCVIH